MNEQSELIERNITVEPIGRYVTPGGATYEASQPRSLHDRLILSGKRRSSISRYLGAHDSLPGAVVEFAADEVPVTTVTEVVVEWDVKA